MRLAEKRPSSFAFRIGGAGRPLRSSRSRRRGHIPKAAIAFALTMMAWLAAGPDVGYADEQWQLGITPSFSSGKYGTDTRTDIVYTPFTARRLFTDGDLTVVLPYTCIRGSGDVTVVDGTPVRTDLNRDTRGPGPAGDGRSEGPTGGRGDRAGAGPESTHTTDGLPTTQGSGALAQDVSTCGMGDIIVRGRYYVLDERGWRPTIVVRAHFKAPTASADAGLGTGRPDEGIGVELSRMIGAASWPWSRWVHAHRQAGGLRVQQPLVVQRRRRQESGERGGQRECVLRGVPHHRSRLRESPRHPCSVESQERQRVASAALGRVRDLERRPDLGFIVGASRRF